MIISKLCASPDGPSKHVATARPTLGPGQSIALRMRVAALYTVRKHTAPVMQPLQAPVLTNCLG